MEYVPAIISGIISGLGVSGLLGIIIRTLQARIKALEENKVGKDLCEKEHGRVDEKFVEDQNQLEKIQESITLLNTNIINMNTNITKLTTLLELQMRGKNDTNT